MFVLSGISDNVATLVQTRQYVAINKTYAITKGYYVIKVSLESYTLQEDTTCDKQISTFGELVGKAQCIYCIQDKKMVVMGKITTTEKYHCSNTHSCKSMSGFNYSNWRETNI